MNLNLYSDSHISTLHVSNSTYPIVGLCCCPTNFFAVCRNGFPWSSEIGAEFGAKSLHFKPPLLPKLRIFSSAFEGGSLGFLAFCSVLLVGVGLWFNVFAFVSNFFAWVWDHDGDFASRSMIVCVLFEIGTVKCSFSVITDHPGVCLSSICMFASVLWCWNFVELLKHFTNCKNFCTDSLIPPSPTGFIERLNVLSLFMIRSLMIRV